MAISSSTLSSAHVSIENLPAQVTAPSGNTEHAGPSPDQSGSAKGEATSSGRRLSTELVERFKQSDLNASSPAKMKEELNTTDAAIDARIGVHTDLMKKVVGLHGDRQITAFSDGVQAYFEAPLGESNLALASHQATLDALKRNAAPDNASGKRQQKLAALTVSIEATQTKLATQQVIASLLPQITNSLLDSKIHLGTVQALFKGKAVAQRTDQEMAAASSKQTAVREQGNDMVVKIDGLLDSLAELDQTQNIFSSRLLCLEFGHILSLVQNVGDLAKLLNLVKGRIIGYNQNALQLSNSDTWKRIVAPEQAEGGLSPLDQVPYIAEMYRRGLLTEEHENIEQAANLLALELIGMRTATFGDHNNAVQGLQDVISYAISRGDKLAAEEVEKLQVVSLKGYLDSNADLFLRAADLMDLSLMTLQHQTDPAAIQALHLAFSEIAELRRLSYTCRSIAADAIEDPALNFALLNELQFRFADASTQFATLFSDLRTALAPDFYENWSDKGTFELSATTAARFLETSNQPLTRLAELNEYVRSDDAVRQHARQHIDRCYTSPYEQGKQETARQATLKLLLEEEKVEAQRAALEPKPSKSSKKKSGKKNKPKAAPAESSSGSAVSKSYITSLRLSIGKTETTYRELFAEQLACCERETQYADLPHITAINKEKILEQAGIELNIGLEKLKTVAGQYESIQKEAGPLTKDEQDKLTVLKRDVDKYQAMSDDLAQSILHSENQRHISHFMRVPTLTGFYFLEQRGLIVPSKTPPRPYPSAPYRLDLRRSTPDNKVYIPRAPHELNQNISFVVNLADGQHVLGGMHFNQARDCYQIHLKRDDDDARHAGAYHGIIEKNYDGEKISAEGPAFLDLYNAKYAFPGSPLPLHLNS